MSVFNTPQVERSLLSLLNQTLQDLEIVVVDDGSIEPATLAALHRIEHENDPRVTLLRQPVNRGLAASLNAAFAVANGRFIARMDADDVSMPQRLEVQRAELLATDVDVLGSAVRLADAAGCAVGTATRPLDHETLVRNIWRENPFFHPTVMMRREVLEELGGYRENLRRSQDRDLWFRAYRRFRFGNVSTPLVTYTQRKRLSRRAILGGARSLLEAGRSERHLPAVYYATRFVVVNGARSASASLRGPK
jgi:glycosyltransferase EpsE